MIPEIPPGMSAEQQLDFYEKLLSNLEDQSSLHLKWFTHRGNPSVCWICDMPILTRKILGVADRLLSKSTLDNGTELSSEDDSDSEIGNSDDIEEEEMLHSLDDISKGKYNEPEYDLIGDEY